MSKWTVLIRSLSVTLALISLSVAGTDKMILRIPQPRSSIDDAHDYHVSLLKLALQKAANGRAVPEFEADFEMEEGRAWQELQSGRLVDVFWLGADKNRDNTLRTIKIPTTRGLIGYRKFIIRRQDQTKFDQVKSLHELRKFFACQGTNWPDTDILNNAQLPVTTSPLLENLYKMLVAKRCDYFPRGYHDYVNELAAREGQYPELVSYEKLMLYYPFAVYFYTNKNNIELATWIEQGLNIAIEDGSFLKLMETHPLTKSVFPLDKERDVIFLSIPNPTLAEDDDYTDSKYWFTPKDFGIALKR
jgi:hypothetical protein